MLQQVVEQVVMLLHAIDLRHREVERIKIGLLQVCTHTLKLLILLHLVIAESSTHLLQIFHAQKVLRNSWHVLINHEVFLIWLGSLQQRALKLIYWSWEVAKTAHHIVSCHRILIEHVVATVLVHRVAVRTLLLEFEVVLISVVEGGRAR